uniref:Integrase family protein n=2 Tax=Rubinisphaera brasiliensis TaxID=119 RepID=F0SPH7_RUBBR|nr:integrase family protein [Rubinisphaera brasiliensis DSM 5305]
MLSSLVNAYRSKSRCSESTYKTLRVRVNFLIRHGGNVQISRMGPDYMESVRKAAVEAGYSPTTIENSIANVSQVLTKLGYAVEAGERLRIPPPEVSVVPLKDFDATLQQMPPYLRAICSLAYVTGLRINDIRKLDLGAIRERLSVRASKTQKVHQFPIPPWCLRQLQAAGDVPRDQHTLYRHQKKACKAAGVDYYTFHDLRVLSANTWNSLAMGLGPLILGNSLPGWSKATAHYLNAHDALFERIADFPPPPSLLSVKERCAEKARKQKLRAAIERLSSKKLETLLQVAEGLAG